MPDLGDPTTLEEAARWELVCLWSDLLEAIHSGINTDWSMECISLAERIKILTGFVGPASWEQMPIALLEAGIYQRIHAEMGIKVEVDMARVAEVRRFIEESRGDRRQR